MEQLQRSGDLSDELSVSLGAALDQAAVGAGDNQLVDELNSLAEAVLDDGGDAITTKRRKGLSETLSGIATGLK